MVTDGYGTRSSKLQRLARMIEVMKFMADRKGHRIRKGLWDKVGVYGISDFL